MKVIDAMIAAAMIVFYGVCVTVPAKADTRLHCSWNRYSATCTSSSHEAAPPIVYTPDELQEMKAREDAWAAYCRPVKVVTEDGLTRVQYQHPNCDIGAYRPQ